MRRRRLLIGLVAAGFAWCQTGEEQIWKEYVAWYRKQPDAVSDPRRAYLDLLRRSGVGEAEVQARSKVIERLSGQRRADASFWQLGRLPYWEDFPTAYLNIARPPLKLVAPQMSNLTAGFSPVMDGN